jgi:hypothetical protein
MEATVAHKKGAASIKPMNTTQMALRWYYSENRKKSNLVFTNLLQICRS